MSSTYRLATAGQSFQLRYSLSTSLSGLFVQAKIYNASDVLQSTTNLTESVSQAGRYVGTATIGVEGDYEIFYIAYTDAGHTTESDTAPRQSESISVTITQSTFGGATLPPMGGITDNDINAIIDGVSKKIGYINPWNIELYKGVTAGEELMKKSELQEVKIPKVDLSKLDDLKETIEKGMSKIQAGLSVQKPTEKIDFQPVISEINKVSSLVKNIKQPDLNKKEFFEKLKEVKDKTDEVLKKPVKEADLSSVIKAIEKTTSKVESLKFPDNTDKLLEQFKDLKSDLKENKDTLKKHDKAEYDRIDYLSGLLKEAIKTEVEKIITYSVREKIKLENLNLEMIKAIRNSYED